MDRKTKTFTGKIRCSSPSNFQAKKHPHRKPFVQKFSTKKLYTGEVMHVGAVPNKESNKELVVDNPKQDLWYLHFEPHIIKIASLNVEQLALCTL